MNNSFSQGEQGVSRERVIDLLHKIGKRPVNYPSLFQRQTRDGLRIKTLMMQSAQIIKQLEDKNGY